MKPELPKHEPSAQNTKVRQTKFRTADELRKFKNLLDCGVITQEEFNVKNNDWIYNEKGAVIPAPFLMFRLIKTTIAMPCSRRHANRKHEEEYPKKNKDNRRKPYPQTNPAEQLCFL